MYVAGDNEECGPAQTGGRDTKRRIEVSERFLFAFVYGYRCLSSRRKFNVSELQDRMVFSGIVVVWNIKFSETQSFTQDRFFDTKILKGYGYSFIHNGDRRSAIHDGTVYRRWHTE